MIGFDDESIQTVGHLGIVAGAYDSLGITRVIDRAIPKLRHFNLSHAQIVKAMSINGLGFIERRLYLFPEFFDDIAVTRLLGPGASRDQLNDDVLGRTLDAIAEYGLRQNCLMKSFQNTFCPMNSALIAFIPIQPISVSPANMNLILVPIRSRSPMGIRKTEGGISSDLFLEWLQISTGSPFFYKHFQGMNPTKNP